MLAVARPLTASASTSPAELDFEALYAQHARYLAGVVHRIMGRDAEVDDVVQETFLDAIDGLSHLEEPSAVRASLVTIAVRRTRRILARRRRRTLFAFWIRQFAAPASDPRDRQAVDELYDALGRLPEDLRIPWILHRVVAMSLPETAAACETSLATVKRRMADAEERLARRLAGGRHE
ncbi:RNA polymerase sigma factor [Pendulispora albinea]|uniref:RNA polymerase sigma factor n=1 Tax=Pendulispora albinea TaxID=2741071 RepID=A0ABZ2MAA0_9BACT